MKGSKDYGLTCLLKVEYGGQHKWTLFLKALYLGRIWGELIKRGQFLAEAFLQGYREVLRYSLNTHNKSNTDTPKNNAVAFNITYEYMCSLLTYYNKLTKLRGVVRAYGEKIPNQAKVLGNSKNNGEHNSRDSQYKAGNSLIVKAKDRSSVGSYKLQS